jgi:hypothetical protein
MPLIRQQFREEILVLEIRIFVSLVFQSQWGARRSEPGLPTADVECHLGEFLKGIICRWF